jgi:hypothetical protein
LVRGRRPLAHRLVVCFIDRSLAHKRNAVAAPASSKRQLGSFFRSDTPTNIHRMTDGALHQLPRLKLCLATMARARVVGKVDDQALGETKIHIRSRR